MGALESAIERFLAARALITDDHRISTRLRTSYRALSDAFTRGRSDLGKNYLNAEGPLNAYVAGFVLTNAAKVARCLSSHLDLLPRSGALSILDVGCGPGTSTLAASEVLERARPRQEVRFVGVESSAAALDAARNLSAEVLPPHHRAEWVRADASSLKRSLAERRFDAAIAANLVNEMGDPGGQRRFCKDLLDRADSLFVIEPALKGPSRDLMALRDRMLDDNVADVVAPCTHAARCPMLAANERDWCHFYVEWKRPRLIEMLDHATNLDHRYLKMSYIVLSNRRALTPGAPPPVVTGEGSPRSAALATWRIVSAPLQSRGKIELLLCGSGELRRMRRLDKNASSLNEDFGRAQRGDLVQFSDTERPGDCRAEDRFTIIQRYNA